MDQITKYARGIGLGIYAEIAEDRELLTLIEIVTEYGKDLPWHMKLLKEYHVPDEKRESAEMIFPTVHKCKGMEYDAVALENDFINEKAVKRFENKKDTPQFEIDKIIEEINLLYVAITRTRNKISLPADLFGNQSQSDDTKSKSLKKNGLKKMRYR
jgi:F-box protein, helicase, 18